MGDEPGIESDRDCTGGDECVRDARRTDIASRANPRMSLRARMREIEASLDVVHETALRVERELDEINRDAAAL
jgi:hypothetical protein